VLKTGGVLLLTVPAVSRIDPAVGLDGEFWRFTAAGCAALLGETFGSANVDVRSYGNVLAAVGILMGLSVEDLSPRKIDYNDELYPVLVTARQSRTPKAASWTDRFRPAAVAAGCRLAVADTGDGWYPSPRLGRLSMS
jgi:hypothetical protein